MLRIVFMGLVLLLGARLMAQEPGEYRQKKVIIPPTIEGPVLRALSFFPELKDKTIHFVFTDKLKKSIMAARPTLGSLFKKQENRAYKVLINPAFKLDYKIESVHQIPDSVMVGWLGHELGHIMDYEHKSAWEIMGMGIAYSLSSNYIRKAERIADSYAVERGMAPYLVAKKSFILDHEELPQAYRDKIAALYLSPEEIDQLVADLEPDAPREKPESQIDDDNAPYKRHTEIESVPGNG